MKNKAKIIAILEQLRKFFIEHNQNAWAERATVAIQQIEIGGDSKSILNDFVGVGMGSLIDLHICSDNGHILIESEVETNMRLQSLISEVLTVKLYLQ